jgi:hypothetical protein
MFCAECGKNFKNVNRCQGCGSPLCPYCIKSFQGKNYCSDCYRKKYNSFNNNFMNYEWDNFGKDFQRLMKTGFEAKNKQRK